MVEAGGSPAAVAAAEPFFGFPGHRLALPNGDSVLVTAYGAQAVSWQAAGRERLFASSRISPQPWPIRAGVPLCWPQFNRRGTLPKHGFARNLRWQFAHAASEPQSVSLRFTLESNPDTLALWPQAFHLAQTITLRPGQLHIELEVTNPGATPMTFTGAQPTYLAVDDIDQARLLGLQGAPEWDATHDRHQTAGLPEPLGQGFDRVYAWGTAPLVLADGAHRLQIEKSTSWSDVVVWNPGPALCAQLPDMAADDHRRMLCVEAAQVGSAIVVPPGAHWSGWQTLTVL
jgi:glucose-6-phosphate 1-epimerase